MRGFAADWLVIVALTLFASGLMAWLAIFNAIGALP
jgi:Zn-dependent protease